MYAGKKAALRLIPEKWHEADIIIICQSFQRRAVDRPFAAHCIQHGVKPLGLHPLYEFRVHLHDSKKQLVWDCLNEASLSRGRENWLAKMEAIPIWLVGATKGPDLNSSRRMFTLKVSL